jgi:hypothetical protein
LTFPIAQEIIARIGKWNCIKLEVLLHNRGNNYQSEETVYRIRDLPAIHQMED